MIVKEEFLSKLRLYFSLNLYEVKIWTALLSRGVSTAGELSDIANVPRSRSYDVLESLEKKGFTIDQYEGGKEPLGHLGDGDGNKTPVRSLSELLDAVRDIGRQGVNIQRYKGLGEMNPDQLYDTTMARDKRKLLQVVIEDAARADEIFTILMGEEVEPRRLFIEANALNVRNLDV